MKFDPDEYAMKLFLEKSSPEAAEVKAAPTFTRRMFENILSP